MPVKDRAVFSISPSVFPGWLDRPHILALSAVNAHQLPEGHRMMVFVVVLVIHDNFTGIPTGQVPFKRTPLLVCTEDEL